MATIKQVKAVNLLVENHGNVSKSMKEAGYTDASAKNPKNLVESKGFKELCEEMGLTDGLIVGALVEDIKANVGKRVPELALAAKIKGLEKAPELPEGNPIRALLIAYGVEVEDDTQTDEPIPSPSVSAS